MKYLLIFIVAFDLSAKVEESVLPWMKVGEFPTKLRIMSYNMLYNMRLAEEKLPQIHQWESRKPRLLEYLAFACADIIGSQELQEDQLEELMNVLGENYAFYGAKTRENEGRSDINAIFYNHNRFELIDAVTIPYSDPHKQNGFTFCYFKDILLDINFFVINSKLSWGWSLEAINRRYAEASQLSEFASQLPENEPILLLGDFNIIPYVDKSSIDEVLTKHNLKDAKNCTNLQHFGPECSITNSRYFFTPFTGPELEGFILDHIYINDKVKVIAHGIDIARVNGEFPSDHFPVIADIYFAM